MSSLCAVIKRNSLSHLGYNIMVLKHQPFLKFVFSTDDLTKYFFEEILDTGRI